MNSPINPLQIQREHSGVGILTSFSMHSGEGKTRVALPVPRFAKGHVWIDGALQAHAAPVGACVGMHCCDSARERMPPRAST